MKELVKEIIEKIKSKNSETYTIENLKKFCSPPSIPKEFNSTKNIDKIKDELKAFTLGCELFFRQKNEKYNGDNQEIKEVGVYQFLQATLQDEVTSIIHDKDYLKNLLELYEKDIEEFNVKMDNGSVIDRYSTVGLRRDINQDSLRVSENGNILIVADGVGGGEDGEIASQKASDTVLKYLNNRYDNKSDVAEETILEDLKDAIIEANEVVLNYAKVNSIGSIGTTLSIALIYNRKLFFGHVGDSRIYRIQENQEPKLITQDHSLPEVLVRNKEIDEDEKENYKKNILVYVIGKKDLKKENLHVGCDGELNNEILFLCSDGVWDIKGIEDKFTTNIEILKRFILNSIPSDNATFIRCKFDYKEPIPVISEHIIKREEDKKKEKYRRPFILIGAGLLGLISLAYIFQKNPNVTIDNNRIPISPSPISIVPITTPTVVSILESNKTKVLKDTPLSSPASLPSLPTKKITSPIVEINTPMMLKKPTIKSNADGDILELPNGISVYLKKKTLTSSCNFKNINNNSNDLVFTLKNTKISQIIDLTNQLKVSTSFVDKLRLIPKGNNETDIRLNIKKGCREKIDKSISNKQVIIFTCQMKVKTKPKKLLKKIELKRKSVVKISSTLPIIKNWTDSDGLYLGKKLVVNFKKDRITLNIGSCKQFSGGKWVCIIPKYKIGGYMNITNKLKKQGFAKKIVLNTQKKNATVRVIITLKEGYQALKERVNGKQVLVFKKR